MSDAAESVELSEQLCDVLRSLFQDNQPTEVPGVFKYYVSLGGDFPARALATFDAVLADPPADLIERMQDCGWIYLTDESDPEEPILSFDDHLAWLRARVEEFRAIADGREPR